MKGVEGKLLNAPMPKIISSQLNKLFDNSEQACTDIAKEYIKEATEKGDAFTLLLSEHETICQYRD